MQVAIQVVNNKKVMAKTPREANLYGNCCVRKGLKVKRAKIFLQLKNEKKNASKLFSPHREQVCQVW